MTHQNFFVASMPFSRPADYCLGYMDGCVFIDFDNFPDSRVRLVRISFDGYGCCTLGEKSIPLNDQESKTFRDVVQEEIKEQTVLLAIVKQAIWLNKDLIWMDPLKEYNLL
jgi:hypothetical protein